MINIEQIIHDRRYEWIQKYGSDPDTILLSNETYDKFIYYLSSMLPPNINLAPNGKHKYMGMDILHTNIGDDDIRVSKTKFP